MKDGRLIIKTIHNLVYIGGLTSNFYCKNGVMIKPTHKNNFIFYIPYNELTSVKRNGIDIENIQCEDITNISKVNKCIFDDLHIGIKTKSSVLFAGNVKETLTYDDEKWIILKQSLKSNIQIFIPINDIEYLVTQDGHKYNTWEEAIRQHI